MQRNTIIKKLLILSACVSLVTAAGCSDSTYISGSASTLPPITEKTQSALKSTVEGYLTSGAASGIPGAIVAIKMNGYQPWYYAYGSAEIDTATNASKVAMKDDMPFHIASISKMYLAQTVIELAKEGKIDLTKSVDYYLPGALWGKYNGAAITVNELLNHTSGIYSYATTDGGLMYGTMPNMDLLLNQFAGQLGKKGTDTWPHDCNALAANPVLNFVNTYTPATYVPIRLADNSVSYVSNPYGTNPYFAPDPSGGNWHYSNTNYYLLGLIIEKITGKTVESEIDRLVVKPLGLTDTYLPPSSKTSASWFVNQNHVHGYTDYFSGTGYMATPFDAALLQFRRTGSAWSNGDSNLEEVFTEMDPAFAWTSGSMISSARDLIKFMQYIMATRIQPVDSKPVWISGSPLPGTETFKYERGLVRIGLPNGGGTAFGHGGQFAGYNVAAFWYADLDIYMVVMTNKYTYFEDQPNELVGSISGGVDTLYKMVAKDAGVVGDPNTAIINRVLDVLSLEPGVAKTMKKAGIATPRFPDITPYMK